MFNLQGSEIIFILLIALVVLGPEKLPSAIKRAMSLYNELRKLSSGFQDEFKSVIDEPMREMKSTADLMKNAADPKRIAEEAEREAEIQAVADKKERQAREVTAAMESAGAERMAEKAVEPTAEVEPATDAFADPVDVVDDDGPASDDEPVAVADVVAETDVEAVQAESDAPRLASVDLDDESSGASDAGAEPEPDDGPEEKSA